MRLGETVCVRSPLIFFRYCIKEPCCSSQAAYKEEHPFAASLLKGHAAPVYAISEGRCLKLLGYWDFSCFFFRAYLVLRIMLVARPACCFKLLVVLQVLILG